MASKTPDASDKGARRPRRRRRGCLARLVLLVAVPGLVAAAILGVILYAEVTLTFEGRLWSLPSRVYSDRLSVATGDPVARDEIVGRLERSGYARIESEPSRPGEFRVRGNRLEVILRAFAGGASPLPERRARLTFEPGRIAAIEDGRGRRIARLVFEPELISLVFGPKQEERRLVKLDEVPEGFVQAVLAAEDARFFSHLGFDPLAMIRAGAANMRSGRIVQGGSTITQQTVKNLYLGQERTLWRKIRELLMAAILDLRYSKQRILEVYLNEVYLGQRGPVAICGTQAAAQHYFGRDLKDLGPAEWAVLAGMIRNPGGYNPFVHPDRALERRDQVLDAMRELDYLDEKTWKGAKAAPLRLATGGAGFARSPYAVDVVRSQLAELYTAEELGAEGLEITTSLDTLLQERAEKALEAGLERLERDVPQVRRQRAKRRLQGAVVAIEPRSGEIVALVGGRDYRESQFNRAVQARRQPGSCFKPIVYLAGLEAGAGGRDHALTAGTVLEDEPIERTSGGKVWRPENYDGEFRGPVTARTALELSLNVPTVRASEIVGLDAIVDTARRLGISSDLKPLPSLALGAQEVTPLELAGAFATIANRGIRTAPSLVREVAAAGGRRLKRAAPATARAVSPQAAFVVTDMMRGVIERGTGAAAASLELWGDLAGKTGTTDDTRDAWFAGYAPGLLVVVWVGYDDNSRTGLTGAAGALPIWMDVMEGTRHRWEGGRFQEPEGIVRAEIDPLTGGLAALGCPERIEEIFIAGTEPTEICPEHGGGGFRKWLRNLFRRGTT